MSFIVANILFCYRAAPNMYMIFLNKALVHIPLII